MANAPSMRCNTLLMPGPPHLLGPWGSAGPGAVRVASSCRRFRPATNSFLRRIAKRCVRGLAALRRTKMGGSGPDDCPAFFTELDQRNHAGFHTLGIINERWFLAFLAGHRLEGVLAGHERDVRHTLLE